MEMIKVGYDKHRVQISTKAVRCLPKLTSLSFVHLALQSSENSEWLSYEILPLIWIVLTCFR